MLVMYSLLKHFYFEIIALFLREKMNSQIPITFGTIVCVYVVIVVKGCTCFQRFYDRICIFFFFQFYSLTCQMALCIDISNECSIMW